MLCSSPRARRGQDPPRPAPGQALVGRTADARLVRGCFVPDQQTREMRNLLRTRKQLVRDRSSHIQRLQKGLEDANIKLDSVITDIVGLSGRRMIEALIPGETDPDALAALAHRRIKASPAELEAALRG
jgi:transposase